jgi:hypothetical protein
LVIGMQEPNAFKTAAQAAVRSKSGVVLQVTILNSAMVRWRGQSAGGGYQAGGGEVTRAAEALAADDGAGRASTARPASTRIWAAPSSVEVREI